MGLFYNVKNSDNINSYNYNNCNDQIVKLNPIMVVAQENNWFYFTINIFYIEWKIARLIWIGFYNNDDNEKCLLVKLSKDIIRFLFSFLGTLILKRNGRRSSVCI